MTSHDLPDFSYNYIAADAVSANSWEFYPEHSPIQALANKLGTTEYFCFIFNKIREVGLIKRR